MRILQVCKKFPWPPRDGESIAIHNLTSGFSGAGHEVTVLAMSTPKHPAAPDGLPDDVRGAADYFAVDVDPSVRPLAAAANLLTRSSYNLERFFTVSFQEGLRSLIRERGFDLIQLEGLYLAPYFKTIRAETDAPVVMRSHNVEFEIWERLAANESRPLRRAYFRLLAHRLRRFETRSLKAWSALVPISPRDEARFRELGATCPIHTCPVGVRPESYRVEGGPLRPDALAYLGALDWTANREGLEWFLDGAWGRLQVAHPGVTLRIAGRNTPLDWTAWDRPGVEAVGEVEDARRFLAEHRVVVVPLLSGSGMRIKIIEALALGRAVVATSVAAEGIEGCDGEHFFIRDTPEGFGGAVLRCLQDTRLAESVGQAGAALVRDRYDIDSLVYALLGFYAENLGL